MNVQKLMQQAQQMQEKLERELEATQVEATVGGGMVTAQMNGHKQLLSLTLDPEIIDPDDAGMLQDLVVAAVNEAARQVDETLKEKVGGLAGGMGGLPGGLPGF